MKSRIKPSNQKPNASPERPIKLKVVNGLSLLLCNLIILHLIPSKLIKGNGECPDADEQYQHVGPYLLEAIEEPLNILTNYFHQPQEVEETREDYQGYESSEAPLELKGKVEGLAEGEEKV